MEFLESQSCKDNLIWIKLKSSIAHEDQGMCWCYVHPTALHH